MRVAIILLAGSGVRFSEEFPKQFYTLNGHPLIYYTIKSFQESDKIDNIVLVSKPEHHDYVYNLVMKSRFDKVKFIVNGGKNRQESAYNALKFLSASLKDDDIVFIHDGARPFVDKEIIDGHIETLNGEKATITAIPATDSIAYSEKGDYVNDVPNRHYLFNIQTPQAFRFKTIYDAHNRFVNLGAADDGQLVIKNGGKVAIVLGNKKLMKITTLEDVKMLKALID